MNDKYKLIILILLTALLLGVIGAGCAPATGGPGTTPGLETSQNIKKFSSVEEIREYLGKSAGESAYYGAYYSGIRGLSRTVIRAAMVEEAVSAGDIAAKSAAPSGGAGEFSATNIQVTGVDEADFVKNDGKYIYVLSQDKLVIVDAYPAEDAEILSKTEIEGSPVNMFVNNDRLVVFSNVYGEKYTIPEYSYIPMPSYSPVTHAYVYDISDRKEPELVNDFSIDGNYLQARMIGDYIYFITQDSVDYYSGFVNLPVVRAEGKKLFAPDVYYFDNPEQNYVFHTIAAFSINKGEINADTFMMGYSNALYVSQDNIYISYQKNPPFTYYKEHDEERFYKVIVPLLPGNVRKEINDIREDDSLDSYERWQKISSVLEDMYSSMGPEEKEDLVKDITGAVEEYEAKLEIERRKTVIHKIAIDKGDIKYVAKGEVSGYLLNQFSMDEFEGKLRVATTTEIWTSRQGKQYNNVYVLDSGMKLAGKLEEIAPDERIYSTRFIGDRLYMVTFKRVDPLFVIGLSNPQNPEILGKLKIPGYSDYLHPYDEDHLIGIGKETADNEWGGISVKGVKLALFDVSDVENPELVDKYEIGKAGTDSEALRDHKAFLFDKKKNLLVMPVREVKGEFERYGTNNVWQGAYVFDVNEKGFKVKGKVSHNEWQEDFGYYWGSPYAVTRSLYMDDVLYTISAKKILMNELDDLEEISGVDLPYKIERPGPYPIIY